MGDSSLTDSSDHSSFQSQTTVDANIAPNDLKIFHLGMSKVDQVLLLGNLIASRRLLQIIIFLILGIFFILIGFRIISTDEEDGERLVGILTIILGALLLMWSFWYTISEWWVLSDDLVLRIDTDRVSIGQRGYSPFLSASHSLT